MREIQLKPTEAEYKVAIIAGADRLNRAGRQRLFENAGGTARQIRFDFAFDRAAADFGNHFVALPAPEFFRRRHART